jgi:hypothetical protein
MTFNNATFASLGVTPGTYVWRWGPGANQRFTLQIGPVPDSGSTASLLGFGLLGLLCGGSWGLVPEKALPKDRPVVIARVRLGCPVPAPCVFWHKVIHV